MKTTFTFVLAALFFCLPSSSHAASILLNGSFEDPDVASGSFGLFASITGWTSSSGDSLMELQDNVAGSPYDGDQHIELDVFQNSNMYQNVATTVGEMYDLSFAYSARPGVPLASNPIDVYFGGLLVDTLSADGTSLADTSWSIYSYVVTATSTSSVLEFVAAGISDSYGGYLDAISLSPRSVQPVPEPSTLLLVSIGLGLAASRRSRKFIG